MANSARRAWPGLSPIVGELAESGDEAARWHVSEMARQLRHSVRQVRHALWLPRHVPVYPLEVSGSSAVSSSPNLPTRDGAALEGSPCLRNWFPAADLSLRSRAATRLTEPRYWRCRIGSHAATHCDRLESGQDEGCGRVFRADGHLIGAGAACGAVRKFKGCGRRARDAGGSASALCRASAAGGKAEYRHGGPPDILPDATGAAWTGGRGRPLRPSSAGASTVSTGQRATERKPGWQPIWASR